ncbi:hypothetical protein C0991_012298, partial [Blastosporella zonata]
ETSREISQEQLHVFAEARKNMTAEERERMNRRADNICTIATCGIIVNEPGTSMAKGKTINPSNWGNVQLDEPELDPEIQWEMLAEFNTCRHLDPQPTHPLNSDTVDASIKGPFVGTEHEQDGLDKESVELEQEVTREEICAYLKDKKQLMHELD